jgi:putative two-component system response regulator
MALSDVYDALLSRRVYKAAMSFEEADKTLYDGMGTQFDPIISELMLRHIKEFHDVHEQNSD